MKKVLVLLLALTALCFAMPAIASPPGNLPAIEAIGPAASIALAAIPQEAAPNMAADQGLLQSAQVFYFNSIAPDNQFSTANAVTLAGLMQGAAIPSANYADIARVSCLSRNSNGTARSLEWVQATPRSQ